MLLGDYEKDSQGNIVTKPLMGWDTALFAGMVVMLGIHYADMPDQVESGNSKKMAFVLNPQQCLDLAAAMTRAATKAMSQPGGSRQ